MKRIKRSLLILGLIASTSLVAGPRGGRGAEKGDMPRHMQKMAEELGLTAEQRSKIQEIHKESRDEIKTLRQTQEDLRKQLTETIVKSSPEAFQQTVDIHEKLVQNKASLMRTHFMNLMQIRTLLTPEQLTKFSKMAPFLDKGRGRGGHGGNDGPFED